MFIASSNLSNSSAATEEAWIETVLGFNVNYTQLDGSISGGSNWLQVQDAGNNNIAGQYAFQFAPGATPDYYLIKTGRNSGSPDLRDFLFQNLDNLNWANINLTLSDGYVITNVGKISHVGIDDVTTNVPEPAPLALLGIGLVGMMISSRRLRTRI